MPGNSKQMPGMIVIPHDEIFVYAKLSAKVSGLVLAAALRVSIRPFGERVGGIPESGQTESAISQE